MTRKLDKEHLDAINSIRTRFAELTNSIGNITIEEIILQRQLQNLQAERERYVDQISEMQQQETELVEKMRERYGEGQINVAEGTFTPDDGLAK